MPVKIKVGNAVSGMMVPLPHSGKVLEKAGKHKKWNPYEDEVLRSLAVKVDVTKTARWTVLAKEHRKITGVFRTGKQCRDRFLNHVADYVKKEPWSKAEMMAVVVAQRVLGNVWTQISKLLNTGRPPNNIKNYWNSSLHNLAPQLLEEYDENPAAQGQFVADVLKRVMEYAAEQDAAQKKREDHDTSESEAEHERSPARRRGRPRVRNTRRTAREAAPAAQATKQAVDWSAATSTATEDAVAASSEDEQANKSIEESAVQPVESDRAKQIRELLMRAALAPIKTNSEQQMPLPPLQPVPTEDVAPVQFYVADDSTQLTMPMSYPFSDPTIDSQTDLGFESSDPLDPFTFGSITNGFTGLY